MTTNAVVTTRDICSEALREAGVSSIDLPVEAASMEVAVKRLNMMLKSWQNEVITVWKQAEGSITVTNATASYDISERPLRIETVNRKDGNEVWLTRMQRQDYMELPLKDSVGTTSSFYYHRQRDKGVLFVWPVPATGSGTLEWSGVAEIEDITDENDTLDVPSEWYEAVLYGLASRVCGAFGIVRPDIEARSREAYDMAVSADVEGSVMFEPDY